MIQIRVARSTDGAACAAIYRPIVEETWIAFETEAPSPVEMSRRIAATLPRFPWLVAVDGDFVLGYAYAGAHRDRAAYRWSVDVTAYLAEGARRKGLGRRLYTVLFDLLRRQGFRSAFAGIALPNAASTGLHEAMGFEAIGVYADVGYKKGDWRDVGWWRLGLNTRQGKPAEPMAFADLRRDAAFSSWLGER
ncbi:arsinothricin resistance N-acetyltransferase ArsN1 family B [Emcibacter sp. SYSU 3D8]|uniref:arsinothricin resistance N-acetyltransferase ArsN1 family B n=1 Tax=Emcibacter sp. SYSU 3D8 TaxID=3133969 RepID=UPI0031FEA204